MRRMPNRLEAVWYVSPLFVPSLGLYPNFCFFWKVYKFWIYLMTIERFRTQGEACWSNLARLPLPAMIHTEIWKFVCKFSKNVLWGWNFVPCRKLRVQKKYLSAFSENNILTPVAKNITFPINFSLKEGLLITHSRAKITFLTKISIF